MSSSGLIYAVIVGAWAAYLVPMWLRRQDELNEARPTERFSTAIRLLSGRAAMERRYAKDLRERGDAADEERGASAADAPGPLTGSVDVRGFAEPRTDVRRPAPADGPPADRPDPGRPAAGRRPARRRPTEAEVARKRRKTVLARRRRTTMVLFLAFTIGAVVAAVGGLRLLWAPAVPALLLSAYIVHLRAQERRRFVFVMDRRRAEDAAQRLRAGGDRDGRARRRPHPAPAPEAAEPEAAAPPVEAPEPSPYAADRRALVEQTDHAEWLDQQRDRERGGRAHGESWEPVPVPLPTYVTAPVAPRATQAPDADARDTWSPDRSSVSTPAPDPAAGPAPADEADPPQSSLRRPPAGRRSRGRTPLFDQQADPDRPRAANE
ncbi:gephyrin-like molybdotransferase receptor GlpR [Streptomyces sp. NPDC060194]|uniref:divisome protein SepX/GlpR n=1 Tax=Streptomyces sp. NPDC060194 TaxID=3347069 RepID=UPI00364AF6D6